MARSAWAWRARAPQRAALRSRAMNAVPATACCVPRSTMHACDQASAALERSAAASWRDTATAAPAGYTAASSPSIATTAPAGPTAVSRHITLTAAPEISAAAWCGTPTAVPASPTGGVVAQRRDRSVNGLHRGVDTRRHDRRAGEPVAALSHGRTVPRPKPHRDPPLRRGAVPRPPRRRAPSRRRGAAPRPPRQLAPLRRRRTELKP